MKLSDLAKIFKALSNEQRLNLFYLLYEWQKEAISIEGENKCCFGVEKAFTKACNCSCEWLCNWRRSCVACKLRF